MVLGIQEPDVWAVDRWRRFISRIVIDTSSSFNPGRGAVNGASRSRSNAGINESAEIPFAMAVAHAYLQFAVFIDWLA